MFTVERGREVMMASEYLRITSVNQSTPCFSSSFELR